ncbi:ABC transporter ATP-binding protein [uncultured Duncaniella sp.]|uniref:ABC transporter ATP-binding protein n=1 Tax=uncultured Duncaniella sp. TaxID=2768039 RepID=UPI0026767B4B|nr:ATP-binding cassette domain-containing protein [uncultured Duncaniella sp.]
MDILQVENVSKSYSSHLALDNVSVNVPEGKVYGLLGPNGAGKTTLIRIINHITAPDSGQVLFNGHRLTQADVEHIGYLPEERGLYKKMKVGEQAVFFARLKGLSKQDAVRELRRWFEKFDILSWWDKKVEELSKGMAQKVQFIITVLHRPQLLIFDEPFSGFDPINAALLKEEILKLKDEGSTVIFSTHNMSSVEEICDNITLINKSRNILSGNVEEIRRQYFGNRYDLTFTGDQRVLMERLQPIAKNLVRLSLTISTPSISKRDKSSALSFSKCSFRLPFGDSSPMKGSMRSMRLRTSCLIFSSFNILHRSSFTS